MTQGRRPPRPPCAPRALRHPAMAVVATTPPSINGRRRRNTSTWRVQDGYFGNPRSNPRLPPPSYRLPEFVIEVLPGSRFTHRRQNKRLDDPPHELGIDGLSADDGSKPMSEVTSETSDQSLPANISPRAAACARTVETTQNVPGAIPVATRLSISLGGHVRQVQPTRLPGVGQDPGAAQHRNREAARVVGSRSSTSPPHLLLP